VSLATGRGAAWLARLTGGQEVPSSNLGAPIGETPATAGVSGSHPSAYCGAQTASWKDSGKEATVFTVRGLTKDGGREAEISWYEPGLARRDAAGNREGLVGDEEIVWAVILAAAEQRTVRATPTGPFFEADLADPRWVLLAISDHFRPGEYAIEGDLPTIDASVPEGAIP
jgi:hypothetical protein